MPCINLMNPDTWLIVEDEDDSSDDEGTIKNQQSGRQTGVEPLSYTFNRHVLIVTFAAETETIDYSASKTLTTNSFEGTTSQRILKTGRATTSNLLVCILWPVIHPIFFVISQQQRSSGTHRDGYRRRRS